MVCGAREAELRPLLYNALRWLMSLGAEFGAHPARRAAGALSHGPSLAPIVSQFEGSLVPILLIVHTLHPIHEV